MGVVGAGAGVVVLDVLHSNHVEADGELVVVVFAETEGVVVVLVVPIVSYQHIVTEIG